MNILLFSLLAIPLFGSALTALLSLFAHSEKRVARCLVGIKIGYLGVLASLLLVWAKSGFVPYEWRAGNLYQSKDYVYPIVLYLDHVGAVFLVMTGYISAIIIRFCRYYMHREEGYARFFSKILLFLFGMTFLTVAGTVDLLFAAWEILGLASFLLIAFYRHRVTPVRSALTAYSVYRVCDLGVLLGAWLSFHIWHSITYFSQLPQLMANTSLAYMPQIQVLSLLLLLAAAGKSAQFPFIFWLPRAMEGPTPSSAIFYGALSIHAGVFLLLRTYPIWHATQVTALLVGLIGGLSAFLATIAGRTQSSIKGQIAYASITQVGLMLIELALGFKTLVLFHFVANASLRCYQLLVSPSVVAQILRMQGQAGTGARVSDWSIERILPVRLRSTFYVLAFNEGYLLQIIRAIVLYPVQRFGRFVHTLDKSIKGTLPLFLIALLSGCLYFHLPSSTTVCALLALAASLAAFAEKHSAHRSWNAIGLSCLLGGVSVWILDGVSSQDVYTYLFGILVPWLIGLFVVLKLEKKEAALELDFLGTANGRPTIALLCLICCLGLAAFPIGPAFVGEDALLHHAVGKHLWLGISLTTSFVLNGISVARLYAHLCLGPLPEQTVVTGIQVEQN